MKKPIMITLVILAALLVVGAVAYIVWRSRRSDGDPDTSVADFVGDLAGSTETEPAQASITSNQNTMSTTTQNHFGDTSLPRGYRNNNPGNIRISTTNWKGKIPRSENTDGSFEQFTTMAYGYRALLVCLNTYMTKHGLTTIRKMINRWAPQGDGNNNPSRYAQRVASMSGIGIDAEISPNDKDKLCRIAYAMATVENGYEPSSYNDIYQGWNLK